MLGLGKLCVGFSSHLILGCHLIVGLVEGVFHLLLLVLVQVIVLHLAVNLFVARQLFRVNH